MTRFVALAVAVVLCVLAPGLFLVPEATAQTGGETASRADDHARSAQRRRPRRRRPRRVRRRRAPAPAAEEAPPAEEEGPAEEGSEPGPPPAEDASDASVRGRVEAESSVRRAEAAAASGATDDEEAEGSSPSGSSLRRSNRMEFDPRLIRGESAGSGAVILFDRGRRALPPLAQRRRRFLRPTIEQAVGRERAARDASSDP